MKRRSMRMISCVISSNTDRAKKYIPYAIADSNDMTGFMLELLEQMKSGDVEIETPMDAVALMMVKIGVSEQDMADVLN